MGQQLDQQFGASQQDGDGQQADDQGDQDGQQASGEGQNGSESGDDAGDSPGDGSGDSAGNGNGQSTLPGRAGRGYGQGHDPFGRATHEGMAGTDAGQDTRVPEQMEQARSRAVQEELRRREAQRTRPQQELDYIGRLLKQD